MLVKEYKMKEGKSSFDLSALQVGYVGNKRYNSARNTLVRTCIDVFLRVKSSEKEDGILLVERLVEPAKGILWSIGGGVRRGLPFYESLKYLVKRESGLEIKKGSIERIDDGRFFFKKNPIGMKGGVDDFTLAFYAVSKGKIKLDELHTNPLIVSKKNLGKFKKRLHPFIKDNLEKIFEEHW